MTLKFQVYNNSLRRLNSDVLFKKEENLSCNITFSSIWKNKEKFVIFKDENKKSEIISLDRDSNVIIPKFCLKGVYFTIQVYADEKLKTQECKVILLPSGYTIEPPKEVKKIVKNECGDKQLFNIMFSKLQDKIDDIKFEDGYLKCYSEGRIIHSVPIFRDLTEDIRSNIRELLPHFEVDENGNLYAIYP